MDFFSEAFVAFLSQGIVVTAYTTIFSGIMIYIINSINAKRKRAEFFYKRKFKMYEELLRTLNDLLSQVQLCYLENNKEKEENKRLQVHHYAQPLKNMLSLLYLVAPKSITNLCEELELYNARKKLDKFCKKLKNAIRDDMNKTLKL